MVSQRLLSRAVWAALLVALATLCAHWFWIFAAPPTRALLSESGSDLARPLAAIRRSELFGAMPAAATAAVARSDLVLRGVSATRPGAMAIIAVDRGRTVAVRAGEDIAPGVRLERVLPDHVIVQHNGRTERIDLARRKPLDTPPVSPSMPSARR